MNNKLIRGVILTIVSFGALFGILINTQIFRGISIGLLLILAIEDLSEGLTKLSKEKEERDWESEAKYLEEKEE